jgi:hypothetical protein
MANYKWKNVITDNIEDAREIIRVTGKALEEGKIDKGAALDNLYRAMKKLESAKYHVERD